MESCISHFVYALAFGSFLHLVFWFSSYHELGEKDAGQHVGYAVIFVQIGHMLMMADFLYYYFKRYARCSMINYVHSQSYFHVAHNDCIIYCDDCSMKDGGPMMLPTHGAYQA